MNQRPQGYEPCELPGCSTPHKDDSIDAGITQLFPHHPQSSDKPPLKKFNWASSLPSGILDAREGPGPGLFVGVVALWVIVATVAAELIRAGLIR